MKSINMSINQQGSVRRLSLFRVLLALLIFTTVVYGSVLGWHGWQEAKSATVTKPWFAPYVDVTATPYYAFEQLGTTSIKNVVLSFIVSSQTHACTPMWGSAYTLDEASAQLDLDRRIERYRQLGGNIAISFGGLLNDELALNCKDPEQLFNAYQSVIDRYGADTVDFDLEGTGLTDIDALSRRATVLAQLQKKYQSEGKDLNIWLTLPASTNGLSPDGTTAVAQTLSQGVDLAGVNVMTMNYGQSRTDAQSMQSATESALRETHRQLGILYEQAGIFLNSDSLWKKIGATPMIGQNDFTSEIFTLIDATGINTFATSQGVIRMSMWSANRDIQCGENYVNINVVSDSCSGIKQDKLAFAQILSKNFDGLLTEQDAQPTSQNAKPTLIPDDPTTSPYQIWSDTGTYLQGTKVVWHGNVYQAKWWTQGELPDNPVLQSWETPWQLVGPVLLGEKPIPQPTLPEGTYPNWSGLEIYQAGERVLFNNTAYQAKWWTQGDSPAASTSNPDSSPWVALTQQQIERILDQLQVR